MIALAKFHVVVIDAAFCSLAGLLAWSFVLGADPRADGENRHLTVIVAAVFLGFILGFGLLCTGRFRPSPWLFVRAAQLAAGIALIQLAVEQQQLYAQVLTGAVGFTVLAACLLASWRVMANSRPNKGLDLMLVYGSLGAALIFAGSYHARTVSLEVRFEQHVSLASLETRHFFGLLPAEVKQLRDVKKSAFASAVDGGGRKLIGAGDETLIVPGDQAVNRTICFKLATDFADFLESGKGSFSAQETHLRLFWWYTLAALAFFVAGYGWDTLCSHLTLLETAQPDEDEEMP